MTNNSVWLVAVTAAWGFLLSPPCIGQGPGFNPAEQRKLSAEDLRHRVTLIGREPCAKCPSVSRFVFEIRDKKGVAPKKTFVLSNETAQVDEIRLTPFGRLVVIGRVLANTSMVTLVDVRSGEVLDSFFCFSPALSPDGRFVSYVKVYPAHFTEGVSAQYVLYDFASKPQENRNGRVSLNNRIDVGLALFPPGSKNEPGDNLTVPLDKRHTMASDAFYWRRDNKTLLFADRANGENWIIVADLSAWPQPPVVRAVPLNTLDIVDMKMCQEFRNRAAEAFHIVGVRWLGARETLVGFRSLSPTCLRRQSIRFSIPD